MIPEGAADRRANRIAHALILGWLAIAISIILRNPVAESPDLAGFIARADALSLRTPEIWSHGFYPLGYPLLLRAVYGLVGDYVIAGKAISLAFGVVGLLAVHAIGSRVWSSLVGLLAVALCCTTSLYLYWSTQASTDMPAAATLLTGLALLARWSGATDRRHLFVVGAVFGLGYLFRYTTLLVVPVLVAWLALRPGSPRSRALQVLLLVAGFVLLASPQLAASWLVHGNPLFNEQVANVRFGMFGDMNWGANWWDNYNAKGGLLSLFLSHPSRFTEHWLTNLWLSAKLRLLPIPALALALVGLWAAVRRRQWLSMEMLLIAFAAAFTMGVCLAFPTHRLLLPTAIILTLFAASGIAVVGTLLPGGSVPKALAGVALLALFAFLSLPSLVLVRNPMTAPAPNIMAISETLTRNGLRSPTEALSFSFYYYDMADRLKQTYATTWFDPGFAPYKSVADLADRMKASGQRFLVIDKFAPTQSPALVPIWPLKEHEMQARFEPLEVVAPTTDGIAIYRLR